MVILQLEEQPLIIQAIFAGTVDEVEDLVDNPEFVNYTDCEKRTPLHAAAYIAESHIAFLLLEHGARVNAKDSKWVTPLHRACAVNAYEVVDVLLKYQADVCARDRLWQTPLHIAAAHDAYNCVDKLLSIIPNPNVTDRAGRTALHHAASNENGSVVKLLITKGCIVNACDKKDCRPLHLAVQMGHQDNVELLLQYQADVNAKDRNLYTPLHVAAANGFKVITRILIEAGAEVNAQNAFGNTPLHVACLNGNLSCCEELTLAGADIEAVNFRGQTPLHVAAVFTQFSVLLGNDCLAFLLKKGADINKCSADGRTPLHMTAIHGRFTRSKTLIDKGALIDCADKNGSTPLHIAAQYGHDILANTLLSFGADPAKKGYEGRTPLHMCCLSGYVECCRKFLQTGVNLNEKDDSGRSPTHCAAYKGSIECLDLLTSNGADFKMKDNFQRLPLHYAAAQGHFQCVFTLVGIGSPINDRDIEGCSPLHLAAAYDHEAKCVEYLLNHRADPKLKDAKGFSPMHYAIACGNVEGVKLLLNVTEESVFRGEAGSPNITPLHLAAKLGNVEILRSVLTKYNDVNIQSDEGITPLILVAREGHIQCVHFLLRFGAKVSLCDNINLMSPIHYSAKNGHSQCLTLLLHNSEDQSIVNMVDSQQRTALMLAVSGNHTECVQALLKCGADPNIVDTDEHSCLFRAVVNGQHHVVQLLLSHSAEVTTRDVNGKTALHLAAACGHLSCLQLLMEYMKEEDIISKDNQECSVLHWACYHGHAHCVEHLLSKNLFKELEGNSYSPVHCACFSGSEQCLEHLINHFGSDVVHLRDEKQRTPLHIAALHGHTECAKLLLKHGGDPLLIDEEGRTPLIAAVQYGQSSIVELLLSFNIDLSACDKDGNTALHWACLKKHHQTALLILENCSTDSKIVDLVNNDKKTPLHIAARNGLVDVTRELLKKGANVLAVDNEGLTPALCCAPNYNVAQCLALILQSCVALILPDYLDRTSTPNGEPRKLDQLLLYLPASSPLRKSYKSTETQTSIVLVTDPDLFELENAFIPPKQSASKIRRNIKIDMDSNCFIKEEPVKNTGAKPKVKTERGKKLHKADKELHLPINEIIQSRPKKNYTMSCRDCQRFQKMCFNCSQKKKIPKKDYSFFGHQQELELGNLLTKMLNEASTNVKRKVCSKIKNNICKHDDKEDIRLRDVFESDIWTQLEDSLSTIQPNCDEPSTTELKYQGSNEEKAEDEKITGMQGEVAEILKECEKTLSDVQLVISSTEKVALSESLSENTVGNDNLEVGTTLFDDKFLECPSIDKNEVNHAENCDSPEKLSDLQLEGDFDSLLELRRGNRKSDATCLLS
ncbi:serine/threonine-protein phosphatase 6 regulatory ankyrin repeat subunit A-like isoform X1 [Anthonomus grandis grandis]|uniref:serine/threonine-protein phosphatase 6 regulatory ankyrin repeat subunit A-like isoform X1 n=1 Tax=Anthonomus grandis grandis TaxID=2921223 RepID=UPI0021661D1C|nr:serine/threonine-protein phosphatase 6 regulatory ankyrin repeat subunit A-like isoform X1 [Anthonomus grandis grandis]